MLTREMLRNFRAGKREVMELRAKMRSAELAAARSDRATDRERALAERAIYEASANKQIARLAQIEEEISALRSPKQRRAIRLKYVEGYSTVKVAMTMGIAERTVEQLILNALKEKSGG